MKRHRFGLALLALAAYPALAYPTLPDGKPGGSSRDDRHDKSTATLFADIDLGGFSVDTSSREETRVFFNSIYMFSEDAQIGWTGTYLNFNPAIAAGDTSEDFKAKTLIRVNYYRAMAGIQANIIFKDQLNKDAQRAALVMSGNDDITHTPATPIPADGILAFDNYILGTSDIAHITAGLSNIAIGSYGPDSIDGYIQDKGNGNTAVGHRRWILWPPSIEMGTGDVPGGSVALNEVPTSVIDKIIARRNAITGPTQTHVDIAQQSNTNLQNSNMLRRANALHILSSSNTGNNTFSAPKHGYVAYPSPGYVPYQLVFPRWSFSLKDANFSGASVTMTRNGNPISVVPEPVSINIGDPTFAWVYGGENASETSNHAKPTADTVYQVTISGITGAPQTSYTYTVTVFDPEETTGFYLPTFVNGPTTPKTVFSNDYTVVLPNIASITGNRWRHFKYAPIAITENAEAGIGTLVSSTSGGYNVIQNDIKSQGSSAFHLTTSIGNINQYLTFSDTFIFSSGSKIEFDSKLGYATLGQYPKVQLSLDSGISWYDIFTNPRNTITDPQPAETIFTPQSIDLSQFAGRSGTLRFAYIHKGGSYYNQTDSIIGWVFDNIRLTNVDAITTGTSVTSAVQASNNFTFTPDTVGTTYGIQAQGMLYNIYETEWGPVTTVNSITGVNANPAADADASTIAEGANEVSGNALVNDTDPNSGDTLSISKVNNSGSNVGAAVATVHGAITVSSNGNYTFTLNNANADVIALNDGQSLQDTVTYELSDGLGGTAIGTISITITGVTQIVVDPDPEPVKRSVLTSLSTRGQMGSGDNQLFGGLIIDGQGQASILSRAIGPSLIKQDPVFYAGKLATDPKATFYLNGQSAFEVDDWDDANAALVASTSNLVGAQPVLDPGAKDLAILSTLNVGAHAFIATDKDGTSGLGLVEIYDTYPGDFSAAPNRLKGISTRALVGTGEKILIAGFKIAGEAKLKVLLRGLGPQVAKNGVAQNLLLADPVITLLDLDNGAAIIGTNDDWDSDNAAAIQAASLAINASQPLDPGSKDAALLVELNPGTYGLFLEGVGLTSGIGLVEVYEIE